MGEKIFFEGRYYDMFGDDPDEFLTLVDPDNDKRPGFTQKRLAKWLPRIPQEVRKIPAVEQQEDIVKLITGYGIWYLTHYGGHLIGLVCGWCGTIFSQAVKFRTGIKQERIPFLDG